MRIFILFITLYVTVFGGGIGDKVGINSDNYQLPKQERTIKTKRDFNDIIRDLENAINHGDEARSGYFLGTVYLTDFTLDDGNITKNIPLAKKYFEISLNAGNFMAAHNLAMIEIHKKKVDESLFLLDQAIQQAKRVKNHEAQDTQSIILFLSIEFGTIVLQYKENDKEALARAIVLVKDVATVSTPSSVYVLANLYKAIGDKKQASLLLNIACKHSEGHQLQEICKFHKEKDTVDENK